ncbi:hypothetical protein SLI_6921 [Streptomyces lividans 1326]|uniref:Uncharacterized protein n=1 Tax=Streptomyces lividans 1326 TaxID=1200984 RepID=A0A7U9HGA3_STRLI|nr:hypothetical protein SLI_6921 [Streptomyces lividans 1326]
MLRTFSTEWTKKGAARDGPGHDEAARTMRRTACEPAANGL